MQKRGFWENSNPYVPGHREISGKKRAFALNFNPSAQIRCHLHFQLV
jgi:hypothetical protein